MKIRTGATAIGVIALTTVAAMPSKAGTFELFFDEGIRWKRCILVLDGGFEIHALEGGDITLNPVSVQLSNVAGVLDGELRLDVTINGEITGSALTTSFLGVQDDYSGVPYFEVPTILIGRLSEIKSFTYKLDSRPIVEVRDSISREQLKQFEDCMMGESAVICADGSILRFENTTKEVQILDAGRGLVDRLPHAADDESVVDGIVAVWSNTPGLLSCSPKNSPCVEFQRREYQYGLYWLLRGDASEKVRCSSIIE